MSKELDFRMSAFVANEGTEGPVGSGTFFEGEIHGLTVRVVQAWQHVCGYVKLPEGHPWLELSDEDIPSAVHGGITYARGHWIGFDTGHGFDVWPELLTGPIPEWKYPSARIWTADLFMAELETLAKDAADAYTKELDS